MLYLYGISSVMVEASWIGCFSMASGIAKYFVFYAFTTIVLASLVATTFWESLAAPCALCIRSSSQCSRLPCVHIRHHQMFGWKGFELVSSIERVQVSVFGCQFEHAIRGGDDHCQNIWKLTASPINLSQEDSHIVAHKSWSISSSRLSKHAIDIGLGSPLLVYNA